MTELAYGSLCTGYDGIGLGLALAGLDLRHAYHAETEPSPAHVLKLEHPDTPNVGDIKTVPWHLAPRTDLMSSGDPCQSISIAGRQEGRDDPRFLWPWVRDAYRAVRPGALFFENVANIVSHDGGRTLAERFEHLRADGYAVRWAVLGACSVGAPHHRHRWYAVAAHVGPGAPAAVRVGGSTAICGAPRSGGRVLLPTAQARDARGASRRGPRKDGYVRTENDGDLPLAVALLPTPAARDGDQRGTPTAERVLRRAEDPMRSLNLEDAVSAYLPDPGTWGKYADAVALWERVTGIPAPSPTEAAARGGRRLNPALPEWMMGLRPGLLTDHLSRGAALKAAGNGVVPLAAAAAWRLLTVR